MSERPARLAYIDCFSGVSGDMLLGALLHAGAPLADLRAGLARLPLVGYTLEAEEIENHGIRGVRAHVRLDDEAHAHRRLADITVLIEAASLPARARERALAIFQRLASAESVVHGVTPEEITFHEVGAIDSIVDIVGVALGLEALDISDLYCSELPLTSGRVTSAHGPLPVPAPATLELLKGTNAVWRPLDAQGELVTPTGAAVVAALAPLRAPHPPRDRDGLRLRDTRAALGELRPAGDWRGARRSKHPHARGSGRARGPDP